MGKIGVAGAEQSEWVVAHQALSRLAKARAAADAEEGRWLLAALRSAAHVHLGFGSFGEGRIRPLPVRAYRLHEVAHAHAALESGSSIGKLVLLP